MKRETKRAAALLLAVLMVCSLTLSGCGGSGGDGLGDLTLGEGQDSGKNKDKNNNSEGGNGSGGSGGSGDEVPALGGGSGSPTQSSNVPESTATPVPSSNLPSASPSPSPSSNVPTGGSTLTTTSYETEYATMTIPTGWLVADSYSSGSGNYICVIHDPNDTNRCIFIISYLEFFFPDEASRTAWSRYGAAFARAPITPNGQAGELFAALVDLGNLLKDKYNVNPIPPLTSTQIQETTTLSNPDIEYFGGTHTACVGTGMAGGKQYGGYLQCATIPNDASYLLGPGVGYYTAYGIIMMFDTADVWGANSSILLQCAYSVMTKQNVTTDGTTTGTTCTSCGESIPTGTAYCMYCGAKQE